MGLVLRVKPCRFFFFKRTVQCSSTDKICSAVPGWDGDAGIEKLNGDVLQDVLSPPLFSLSKTKQK